MNSFSKDDAGGPAIEFALIAPIMIGLMIATVQVGFLGLMSNNLDAAVATAARKIRTGAAPASATGFADEVCAVMVDSLAVCRSRLRIGVQKATDFSGASALVETQPSGQYNAGGAGDIILVRATYRLPLMLPLYTGGFQPGGAHDAVIDARTAFRNEPFE